MFKNFDIILVHKKRIDSIDSIPAPFIRIATKCYYNHAAIAYRGFVFEANTKGFEPFMSIEEYQKRIGKDIEIAILRPLNLLTGGEQRLKEIIGKGYDYWSLLWFQILLLITGKWKGHTGKFAKEKVYCSEACAYIAGLEKWWTFSPAMLWRSTSFDIMFESNPIARQKFDKRYERGKN